MAACSARPANPKERAMKRITLIAAAVAATVVAAGCASMSREKPIVAVAEMQPTTAAAPAGVNPVGLVRFTQIGNSKVLVEAEIKGLKPHSEHGFHVHAVPDCSGDGLKTGAHFNPDAHPHNHPSQMIRHAGAMFNLKTDAAGTGTTRQEVDTITLQPGKYSIVGMPLITHRDPDDYASQPLGNAGPRVSCGLIKLVPTP